LLTQEANRKVREANEGRDECLDSVSIILAVSSECSAVVIYSVSPVVAEVWIDVSQLRRQRMGSG
jgi:hypothetical protein